MHFSSVVTAGALVWAAVADPAPAPTAAPEPIAGILSVQGRQFSGSIPGISGSIGWNGYDIL
jgi:hypothetical protein